MATRKRVSPLAEQILETLEERGYRSTEPRRTVVQAVVKQERHFTAEELRRELPRLGRATVFRSLKLLVDNDVLCRVMLEDGDLHYQLSNRGHHHHLLCVECGMSEDLMGCDIQDVLARTSANHNFELSGHWLEVYGRCRDCRQKGPPPG
jgi:Fe2+ or Zn2+ uptake regulation protein